MLKTLITLTSTPKLSASQIPSSPGCGIHETSLLLCIRAMFHVYLVAKGERVRGEAREGLVRVLGGVFGRMEGWEASEGGGGRERGPKTPERDNGSQNSAHRETETTGPSQSTPVKSPHQVPITPDRPAEGLQPTTPGRPDPKHTTDEVLPPTSILFKTQLHKDAFLIFRALCKLSSKPLDTDNQAPAAANGGSGLSLGLGGSSLQNAFMPSSSLGDPLALSSKLLSLELLLAILEQAGPAFRLVDGKFIYAVRQYLAVSLLKNCMSANTSVVFVSLRIFVQLVRKLRSSLKQEIEVFVSIWWTGKSEQAAHHVTHTPP